MANWPERIEYRWTDDVTGTPYSLYFDDVRSCIAYVVSQGNNLRSPEEILDSLFDAATGKSLSDPSVPVTADDVTASAPAGTVLPPAPEADPEPASITEEPVDPELPRSTETTGTANVLPTASPVDSGAVDSAPGSTGFPTDTGSFQAPTAPVEAAPTAETTAPDSSVPAIVPADQADTETDVPGTLSDVPEDAVADDESDDFDNVGTTDTEKPDDGPEDADNAPSIGTPVLDTPGVTGSPDDH